MADYPVGIVRKTAGGQVGTAGKGFRIYSVYLKSAALSVTSVTFYAGTLDSASVTSNALLSVYINVANPTSNTFDSHQGVLFNGGCYMTTAAAIDYVTIVGRTELY